MLILALDTSGPEAGVALMRDGALIYEATAVNKLTHSVNLMPMVEEALLRAGQSVGDVSLLAAVVGPGSFTGVRIGVSAVKAMAFARQRPVIGVNALEALAHGLVGEDRLICPIRDARAGQVYGAAFFRGERLMADAALKLPDYLRAIAPLGDKAVFVGDGAAPMRESIEEILGDRASFAPAHLNLLKPGSAAHLAWLRKDEACEADSLSPFYLRQPQAERERTARGG